LSLVVFAGLSVDGLNLLTSSLTSSSLVLMSLSGITVGFSIPSVTWQGVVRAPVTTGVTTGVPGTNGVAGTNGVPGANGVAVGVPGTNGVGVAGTNGVTGTTGVTDGVPGMIGVTGVVGVTDC
jgi:hypothetical protein